MCCSICKLLANLREATFEVISGYRSPATNLQLRGRSSGVAAHSLHMEGKAIDIRMSGFPTAKLRDCARSLQRGGVGYSGIGFRARGHGARGSNEPVREFLKSVNPRSLKTCWMMSGIVMF